MSTQEPERLVVRHPNYEPITGQAVSGVNAYQLCLAEALILGYSIGTGKPVDSLPVKGWRGEFAEVYRRFVSGMPYDSLLASYFRHPLNASDPIKSLVDIVRKEHETWAGIELRKRITETMKQATPEQLAQALAIIEGKTDAKARTLPGSLGQPARPAPQVHQSTGAAIRTQAPLANSAGAGQPPGPKR